MKTTEEYFKMYCDNPDTRSFVELFLIEIREKIIVNIEENPKSIIPQKYLDMMQLFDDRWNAVADMTKDTDKPLNRRSLATSIEVYYSNLYRRWKRIKKGEVIWQEEMK